MSRRAKKTVLVDTPSPRKRAVIYKRASTNESNQPHSLVTQDVEGRRFVEGKDCELVGVYEEYASGKDQNRRKLQELLRDARGRAVRRRRCPAHRPPRPQPLRPARHHEAVR